MFTMRPYFNRICVFLIILLGNEVSGNFPWQTDFLVKHSICYSPECNEHANYLHNLLNYDVNPCDDFYQYVCGKWGQKKEESDYYSQWSVDMEMADTTFKRIKDILYTTPTHLDTTELKQGRALYEACSNIPYLGILDAASLRNYITFDHFPLIMSKTESSKRGKLSWLDVHNYYLSITGESAFLFIEIGDDLRDKLKPILRISRMESPFGLIESLEGLRGHKLILYKEFLLKIIIHLIPPEMCKVSYTLVGKRVLDVLEFRRELWKLTSRNKPNPNNCYLMTKRIFDNLYISKKMILWANVIYTLHNATDDPSSITSIKICTEKDEYFDLLTQLLSKTDNNVLVNHIHLYFMERHIKLTPHLREMLMKVVIQNGKLEDKIRYLGKREVTCLLMSTTTDGFGKAYINRYFPPEIKKRGELLINKVKDVMKIQISQSTWLDANMKKKAMTKIWNMKTAVGYPEYYDDPDLRTDYKHPDERVQVVTGDVFYSATTNRLSISAAYFNRPLYDPTFPPSIIYGSIGTSVAHEMYHAFGPSVLYHKSLPSYWSKKMLSKHKKRLKCFVEQYNKKSVKELRDIPNAPTIDGHRTLDENISDSMGLNLAYWTFRKEIWTSNMCRVLKSPVNLTCDQLFFVSYALNFCSIMTLDQLMDSVQNQEHCPDSLRVNLALSNLEEFSKAFNCPKAAWMNPRKRCNLWT